MSKVQEIMAAMEQLSPEERRLLQERIENVVEDDLELTREFNVKINAVSKICAKDACGFAMGINARARDGPLQRRFHAARQKYLHRRVRPLNVNLMSASASPNNSSSGEILDVRGMPSPENVLAILKRATELPKGAAFEIRSDANPWQLYDLLQQRGFVLLMERQKDGSFAGKIRPRDMEAAKH